MFAASVLIVDEAALQGPTKRDRFEIRLVGLQLPGIA